MIRVPSDYKWKSSNNSDLFGNVVQSKNLNFDEEGYVKLSSRLVSVMSEDTDGDFQLPVAFGRKGEGSFEIVTAGSSADPFDASISATAITVTEDSSSNNPNFTADSSGVWFQNRWYTSVTDDLHYKSGSTWTDAGLSLTSSVPHPLEVFRNRNTLCVGNANVVKQYTTAHAASVDLTIPADFVVIGLAYSGNKMGIITKLSATADGQNQDAYFFVWDGKTTSANSGVPIGSDMAAGIVAYKGSWVIVTRTGQLLLWNGGGFTELAAFPFYFKNLIWGDFANRVGKGVNMWVEGDVIYINLNLQMDQYGKLREDFLPGCPSGTWCLDPKVGLYHRYSPSLSPISAVVVAQGDVNTTTNVLTKTSGTIPETGNPAKYTDDQGSAIGGLAEFETYYVIKVSSTTFKLASSKENAEAGIAIDLTSQGGTQHTFMVVDVRDFGASAIGDAGGIALMGVQSPLYDHVILGADMKDYDSASNVNHLNVSISDLENRGYLVTAKVLPSFAEDTQRKLIVPFRPLKEADQIIAKVRNTDLLGIPVTTAQGGAGFTWTGTDEFYTTANLSAVKTAFDADHEIECEIISGAGAGAMAKVSSITEEDGTYALELAESVPGAAGTRVGDAVFHNWKVIKTIQAGTTDAAKGYAEFSVAKAGKWAQYKFELRGIETTIEPFLIDVKARK